MVGLAGQDFAILGLGALEVPFNPQSIRQIAAGFVEFRAQSERFFVAADGGAPMLRRLVRVAQVESRGRRFRCQPHGFFELFDGFVEFL